MQMVSKIREGIKWSLVFVIFLFYTCSEETPAFRPGNLTSLVTPENARFYQISSADTTGGNNDRINIHPGKTATIADIEGPGMLSRIWFTIDSRDPDFLRHIVLRIYWDEEMTPSVEVPVGDFFGSAFGYKHHTPQLIGMSSGGYYCYFPMPFKNRARVEIVNDTGEEVYAFYYQIGYYQFTKDLPEKTLYFHARWNRDIRTNYPENYVALDARGNGYFVGLHFNAQSYDKDLVYLEGDEMLYVDGEDESSIAGTGLEDYFNSGWYFQDGPFDAAYHGLVLMDTLGRVSAYRHHWPDAIPFSKSIRVTLEHGHGNEEAIDLSTTAFWYQQQLHKPFLDFKIAGQRTPLNTMVPNDVLEAEDFELRGAAAHVQDMTTFGSDWSGGQQLRIDSITGASFEVRIPNLLEAQYDIDLYLTQGPEYGNFTVKAGNSDPQVFKGTAESEKLIKAISFKGIIPENDTIILKFYPEQTLKTMDNALGFDAVSITPVRQYIPEWYIVGPFPNPRESDYLRYGLDSVYPPELHFDRNATYTGVNDMPITWQKISGKVGGYGMGLSRMFNPREFIISYARTEIYSPKAQTVSLLIGSDDGSKVFLNQEEVYRFLAVRIAAPDQDTVALKLKPGWNSLMIKAENNFGGYAFYARILDLNENLKLDVDGAN